jgi:ubiquinone/menaquinone biosynthesis C-methylase UbiE
LSEVRVSDHHRSNYRDYYADGGSEWRRIGAIGKAENIISLCRDLPHNSILEIGAGEGSILKRLSDLKFGKQLHALEISPSGVEAIINKSIPRLVECLVFDGYHIPYENDTFNLAVLSHVIEHAEHPRQLLYEASRVARYIFVEVPLEDTIRLPSDFTVDNVGHINFYSPKSIRRLVQSCGLRILHQITKNSLRETYTYKNGNKGLINYYVKQVLLNVFPSAATRLCTYHGALVCEKTGEE